MNTRHPAPLQVALPTASRIHRLYGRPDLADAFSIVLPDGTVDDAEVLARFVFAQRPRWVAALMRVRDAAVGVFGLKTASRLEAAQPRRQRIGIFRVYEVSPHEAILGEDDKHLDFRISVLYSKPDASSAQARLVLSTVVDCHNRAGRAYIAVIAPFHRAVVQSFLRNAAKTGWPSGSIGARS